MSALIKVADIANQALYEFEEQTTHLKERALYHAFQLLKDVALNGRINSTKSAVLPVNMSIRAVTLPPDFVDAAVVKVMWRGRPVEVSRSRGKAGEQPGYVVDYDRGAIYLPSQIDATEIMLEYICSGVSYSGETKVHPYLEKPILTYVYWKMIARRRDYSGADKAKAEREHTLALKEAYSREGRFTINEFLISAGVVEPENFELQPVVHTFQSVSRSHIVPVPVIVPVPEPDPDPVVPVPVTQGLPYTLPFILSQSNTVTNNALPCNLPFTL